MSMPRDRNLERRYIRAHRKHGSAAAVAKVLGVSRQRAHFVLKRAGVL